MITNQDFTIAQLRHAWHHLNEGRLIAGKEVLASVIRSLEYEKNEETATNVQPV